MRTFTRSLGVTLASAGAAIGLAFTSAAPADATNQVLMLGGIASSDLSNIVMASVLGGAYAGSNYERHAVSWPAQARPVTGSDSLTLTQSVNIGAANLQAAVTEALSKIGPGEQVIIVGLSAGSLVVDKQIAALAVDPDAPEKSRITFVVVSDANRSLFNKNRTEQSLGFTYNPPPDVKYNTTVVTSEYDGFGDFPDRWWNLLAVANAYSGTIIEHVPNMFTDLSTVPTSNITVTTNSLGGVTTSYLIPAEHLPLVILLPFLKPYEAQLKTIIDKGYSRNDNKASGASSTTTALTADTVDAAPATVAEPVVSEPTPVSELTVGEPAAEPVSAPVAEPVSVPAAAAVSAPVAPVSSSDAPASAPEPVSTPAAAAVSAPEPVSVPEPVAEPVINDPEPVVADSVSAGTPEPVGASAGPTRGRDIGGANRGRASRS